MYSQVNETVKADSRVSTDIASLTAGIIGRSRVRATAALYLRIANIVSTNVL